MAHSLDGPLLAAERGEGPAAVSTPRRPLPQRLALALAAGLLVAAAAAVGSAAASSPAASTESTALLDGGIQPVPLSLSVAFWDGSELRCPIVDRILAKIGYPCGRLIPPPKHFGEMAPGVFGLWLSGGVFLIVEGVLLVILEKFPQWTSTFVARKICHAGSGFLFMTLDVSSASARGAMYAVGIGSILMTWEITKDIGLVPFRFGKARDTGITIYLIIILLWFFSQLPARVLAPMFFADPAGAVVGKYLSKQYGHANKVWYNNKTYGGSIAVFLVTVATLWLFYPPFSLLKLLLLAVLATLAEGFGGEYDNLCVAAVVIGGYYLMEGTD